MFEMTRHHLRQVRYRWLSWRADPLYLLFERMYRCDPGARHSCRARVYKLARDPGRFCHRICP